jgi:predicted nucleic-acid-binding protein
LIAIDTNVLVRLLTGDDPEQSRLAQALVADAEANGLDIHLDEIVLAETAWVLHSSFGVDKAELVTALDGLLDTKAFSFANRSHVAGAVRAYERGGANFADCLIVARNAAAGCTQTFTFDAGMRRLKGARVLEKTP